MAKFLPVVGEVYTAVEFAVCTVASGAMAVYGDMKSAEKWLDAADQACVEYAERNLLVTPFYIGLTIDDKKREELKEKFVNTAGNFADGIPVVGHIKGIVHYALGDDEKGNRSMEAATRTAAVLGAGVLTGGLGAGVALGAVAGVYTGFLYDSTATVVDSVVNEEVRLHGSLALIEADKMTPNELTQSVMGLAGDALSGAAGTKLGKNIRAHLSKSAGQKNLVRLYTEAGEQDPRQATRLTMETAKVAKEVHDGLDTKVKGCTTKVVDKSNGKSGIGNSGIIRNKIRAQNFAENGFTSKKAAIRANDYGIQSHLQETFPDVKPVKGRSVPQNACAEHQAFNNYNSNNPVYSKENTQVATVWSDGSEFFTKKRCDNCKAYGPNMGHVFTDQIPTGTPVPSESYIAAGSTIGASTIAAGGAIVQGRKQYS